MPRFEHEMFRMWHCSEQQHSLDQKPETHAMEPTCTKLKALRKPTMHIHEFQFFFWVEMNPSYHILKRGMQQMLGKERWNSRQKITIVKKDAEAN